MGERTTPPVYSSQVQWALSSSDLRHGVRHLITQPVVAAAAIGSLALGIGLNVAIFSVVNAVLLRGQPLERPDRLVEIYSGLSKELPASSPRRIRTSRTSSAAPTRWQASAGSSYVRGILASSGRGALVTGETVTANYFDLLGIPLEHGRGFRADENMVARCVTGDRRSATASGSARSADRRRRSARRSRSPVSTTP